MLCSYITIFYAANTVAQQVDDLADNVFICNHIRNHLNAAFSSLIVLWAQICDRIEYDIIISIINVFTPKDSIILYIYLI